jgi:hypothetical protein
MDSRGMSLHLSLFDVYQGLVDGLKTDEDSLHVEIIPGFNWARLGVTEKSLFLLLPADSSDNGPEFDLEHIQIIPRKKFHIRSEESFTEETVAIIQTKSRDEWLVETFLGFVEMLFETGVGSDPASIQELIKDLVALFRALTQASKKSTLGLWGELFLIHQAVDIELAVKSWHTTPNDRYDFASRHERVEVKTTADTRVHTFSHSQLSPVNGLRVTIASLVVSPSGEGFSCGDFVNAVLPKINSPSVRRIFVDQVVRTLGENWNNQAGYRYDLEQAAHNLRFYDIEEIPKITESIPLNVHDVKYRSDLQVAAELSVSDAVTDDILLMSFLGTE